MIKAKDVLSPDVLSTLMQYPEVPVVLDSGWHKSCSFEDYADLLGYLDGSYPGRFTWFAAYDVEDQATNERYYQELMKRNPHLRGDIRWIFRLHWGTRDERARQAERLYNTCRTSWRSVGLGGLVPLLRRNPHNGLILLQEIGEVLGELSLPTHVFGVSSPTVLSWLRTQPYIQSMDSSRWLVALRGKEIVLLDGMQRRIEQVHLPLTAEDAATLNIRTMQRWVDPMAAPHVSLWEVQSGEEDIQEQPERISGQISAEDMLRWFLTYSSRIARFHEAGSSPSTGTRHIYVPLFAVAGREYGLRSWEQGNISTSSSEWSLIWDVLPGDPPTGPHCMLHMDGKLKSGLFSHDDIHAPCLCRYPLPVAIAVAKAMTPV